MKEVLFSKNVTIEEISDYVEFIEFSAKQFSKFSIQCENVGSAEYLVGVFSKRPSSSIVLVVNYGLCVEFVCRHDTGSFAFNPTVINKHGARGTSTPV